MNYKLWAEMVWAEMVMGRNGHGPEWLWAEMTSDPLQSYMVVETREKLPTMGGEQPISCQMPMPENEPRAALVTSEGFTLVQSGPLLIFP